MAAERPLVYADSSALVKLVIEEPESAALAAHLEEFDPVLMTSRLALVEVVRAVGIANPSPDARAAAEHLVESCLLVEPTEPVVRTAADLASLRIRTLDAIHLASAQRVGADAMLVYDARLKEAATHSGISALSPATTRSN